MTSYHSTSWSKNSPTFFKLGLVISLALSIVIINYETNIKIDHGPTFLDDVFHVWETEVQSHTEVLPVVSKPSPKPVILETAKIVISDKADEQPLEDIKENPPQVLNTSDHINYESKESSASLVISEKPDESNKVYITVENMPYLSYCENVNIESERRLCTQENLLNYIRKHLKYPTIAREIGIQGVVVVSFVIDKSGLARDFTILRDIGGGCGQEAVRILGKAGDWSPGVQNNKPVHVKYTVPIKFSLQ